jgi:hypothetical protein
LTHPFDIYIDAANSYTSIWVTYLHGLDSASSYDTSLTKVETTSAITVADYTLVPAVYLGNTNSDKTSWTSWNNINPSTNNTLDIGTSSVKWRNIYATSVLIGSSASYGSTTVPIYWNAGVPTAVSANSLIVNLATTSGASVYASAPRPGVTGTLPVGNGGTGAASFTANSIIISGSTTTSALTTGPVLSAAITS